MILIILLFILLSSFVYSDACNPSFINDNLLAYYIGNETTFTYQNAQGNTNLDLLNGLEPDRTIESWGYGMDFEKGNTDYLLTIVTEDMEFITHNYTIAFHFIPESDTGDNQLLLSSLKQVGTWKGLEIQFRTDRKIAHFDYYGNVYYYTKSVETFDYGTHYYIINEMNNGTNKIFFNNTEVTYTNQQSGMATYWTNQHRMYLGSTSTLASHYDGILGNFIIINATLNASCREYIQNNQYPFISDTTPPILNLIYPLNNTRYNNYNGSIIINATDDILMGNCSINNTDWVYSDSDGVLFRFDNNTMPDNNYSIFVNCSDDIGNSANLTFNFLIDSIYPVINVYSPLNNSFHNSDILINVSYYDTYLYRSNTTIINNSNKIVYTNDSGILFTEYYNISELWNISILQDGLYNITFEGTDTHTSSNFNEILNYETGLTNKNKNSYVKYFMKYGEIEFITPLEIEIQTLIFSDRWKQLFFNLLENDLEETEIEILANNIEYFKDSSYNCHLILNNNYWFDCNGLKDAEIIEYSKTKVKFKFFHEKDNCLSESLGGLNYINKSYIFTIDRIFPILSNYNVTNGSNTIKWDLLFSENSTYIYTIGLNCSDSSIGNGNGINDFLSVTSILLDSGTNYFFNINISDNTGNYNEYCINGITTGTAEIDYNLIQSIIEDAVSNEVEEMNDAILLLVLFIVWGFLLFISIYLNNGTFIAFTALFGLFFSIYLFTSEVPKFLTVVYMGLNAYILFVMYNSKNG